MDPIHFKLEGQSARARCGTLYTGHGAVSTPRFMPVGTRASVKTLGSEDLERVGAQIALANTYHLYLRPGVELIEQFGGLHRFMSFKGALLTDSGGYQVMSLAKLNKVSDEGVNFQSHLDGSRHQLTPEKATDIQARLGADVIMCLDHCLQADSSRELHVEAVRRTTDWAARCRGVHGANFSTYEYPQALFGIVQGGIFEDLRRRSAAELQELGFPGYAIGGLAVGEPKPATLDTVELMDGILPSDRPRYLMGVGYPEDLVWNVKRGVDLFDCVLPTRNARNGMAFTSLGRLVIKNAIFQKDERPLDEDCSCWVCERYSRAYIRHLQNVGEILGFRLVTYHNIHFYLDLMRSMRCAIQEDRFRKWEAGFFSRYQYQVEKT